MSKPLPIFELETDTISQWTDLSGHGYNAIQPVVANQPAVITDGAMFNQGACYQFTANNHWMYIPNNPDIDITTEPFWLSIWCKSTRVWDPAQNDYTPFIGKHLGVSGYGFHVREVNAFNELRVGMYIRGVGLEVAEYTLPDLFFADMWTKVDGVYDSDGYAHLYINGDYMTSSTNPMVLVSGYDLYIGRDNTPASGSIKYWDGYLARPRMLKNYEPSAAEIASQYKMDLTRIRG